MSPGKTIVILGLILVGVGLLLMLPRLPGDIEIRGKNSVFYFPLATCALASILLSLLFWFFGRR